MTTDRGGTSYHATYRAGEINILASWIIAAGESGSVVLIPVDYGR